MEGLEWLCSCCKNIGCNKNKIVTRNKDGCKTIKCLRFKKDDNKITPSSEFDYKIRSDEQ